MNIRGSLAQEATCKVLLASGERIGGADSPPRFRFTECRKRVARRPGQGGMAVRIIYFPFQFQSTYQREKLTLSWTRGKGLKPGTFFSKIILNQYGPFLEFWYSLLLRDWRAEGNPLDC